MTLKIKIEATELFNEETMEIIPVKETVLTLKHSLLSLYKWESKWHKPFLHTEKTNEQTIDYIRCMTITQNVPDIVYWAIDQDNMKKIQDYINDPMTATWFSDKDNKKGHEIVTAEIIYYWMIKLNIPFECEKWHLNRLWTLIKVCSIKEQPPKNISKNEWAKQRHALNSARRRKRK